MQPIAKLQYKSFHVAFWERTGQNGKYYTVTLQRRYKMKYSEEWKSEQINMFLDDITPLIGLLTQAVDKSGELKKQEPSPNKPASDVDNVPDDIPF